MALQIKNIIRKILNKKIKYKYFEMMACLGGCINGNALLKCFGTLIQRKQYINELMFLLSSRKFIHPEENDEVVSLYSQLKMKPYSRQSKFLFYSKSKIVKSTNNS